MFASTAGYLVDRVTQRWVQFTGKEVDFAKDTWLQGPIGEPHCIGTDYFHELARKQFLQVRPGTGLLDDFDRLKALDFDPSAVTIEVSDFYEKTAYYEMDAWSEWCCVFRPFGTLLALIFSRRLQQLNIPLSSLETSRGLTSEILELVDPRTGHVQMTAWLRRLLGNGNVLYAGAYSTCRVPNYQGECVKVVFPLPNGNAMVIMRPVAHADGSFSLVSHGERFGDPGFYFTVHSTRGVHARYLRSLRESIRIYSAEQETVRADHVLTLWGLTFLKLHYRLRKKGPRTSRFALA